MADRQYIIEVLLQARDDMARAFAEATGQIKAYDTLLDEQKKKQDAARSSQVGYAKEIEKQTSAQKRLNTELANSKIKNTEAATALLKYESAQKRVNAAEAQGNTPARVKALSDSVNAHKQLIDALAKEEGANKGLATVQANRLTKESDLQARLKQTALIEQQNANAEIKQSQQVAREKLATEKSTQNAVNAINKETEQTRTASMRRLAQMDAQDAKDRSARRKAEQQELDANARAEEQRQTRISKITQSAQRPANVLARPGDDQAAEVRATRELIAARDGLIASGVGVEEADKRIHAVRAQALNDYGYENQASRDLAVRKRAEADAYKMVEDAAKRTESARKTGSAIDDRIQNIGSTRLSSGGSSVPPPPDKGGWSSFFSSFADGTGQAQSKLTQFKSSVNGSFGPAAISLVQPFIALILGLVGAMGSLYAAGIAAGTAIGVTFIAAIAQGIPVLGLFAAATQRLTSIMSLVQLTAGQVQQKFIAQYETARQNAMGINQVATAQHNYQDALFQSLVAVQQVSVAEHGLSDAQFAQKTAVIQVQEAQVALSGARRDAARQLQALIFQEVNARLAAEASTLAVTNAQKALAQSIATGGDVASAQLDLQSAQANHVQATASAQNAITDASKNSVARQQITETVNDAQRGVEQARHAVIDANQALSQAALGVVQAKRAVVDSEFQVAAAKAAIIQAQQAAVGYNIGTAAQLAYLRSQMTQTEKSLAANILAIYKMFQGVHGYLRPITDSILGAFIPITAQIEKLLKDPRIFNALLGLGQSIGAGIKTITNAVFSPEAVNGFLQILKDAAANIGPVATIISNAFKSVQSIITEADPFVHQFLLYFGTLVQQFTSWATSTQGKNWLKTFFSDAFGALQSFVGLGAAIVKLFAAIIGPGGGARAGIGIIQELTLWVNRATDSINSHGRVWRDLQKLWATAKPTLSALGEIFKAIVNAFIKIGSSQQGQSTLKNLADLIATVVIPALTQFVIDMGKVFDVISKFLNAHPRVKSFLIDFAGIFLTLRAGTKILGALAGPFSILLGIFTKMGTALSKVGGLVDKLKNSKWFGGVGGGGAGGDVVAGGGAGAAGAEAKTARGAASVEAAVTGAGEGAAVGGAGAAATGSLSLLGAVAIPVALTAGLVALSRKIRGDGGINNDLKKMQSQLKEAIAAGDVGKIHTLTDSISKFGDKLSNIGAKGADQFKALADAGNKAADQITAHFGTMSDKLTLVAPLFKAMAGDAGQSLSTIVTQATSSASAIASTLGTKSNDARVALATNFKIAADDIRSSMQAGVINTGQGLKAIHKMIAKALNALGGKPLAVSNFLADVGPGVVTAQQLASSGDISQGALNSMHAVGGFVGNMGERGRDAVHAVVGRGEAILNYAHQKVVDPALRAMYGPNYGLSTMFSNVRGEHAGGGTGFAAGKPGVDFDGTPTNVSSNLLSLMALMEKKWPGLTVTATTNGTHAKGSYHYRGEAVDMASSDYSYMDKVASWVQSSGLFRSLAEGIHNPNLSVKYGKDVPSSYWGSSTWGEHLNHIHLAITGAVGELAKAAGIKAGGAGSGFITAPNIRGKSVLADLLRTGMSQVTSAANTFIGTEVPNDPTSGAESGAGTPVHMGSGFAKALQWTNQAMKLAGVGGSLWQKMLLRQEYNESTYNPDAINKTDSNAAAGDPSRGILQTIGSTFAQYALPGYNKNIYDPVSNIIAAIRYMIARYGHGNKGDAAEAMWERGGGAYAGGGFVGKAIPIIAHAGEWVLNKGQQSKLGQMMGAAPGAVRAALGLRGGMAHFQDGGVVGAATGLPPGPTPTGPSKSEGVTSISIVSLLPKIIDGLISNPAELQGVLGPAFGMQAVGKVNQALGQLTKRGKLVGDSMNKFLKNLSQLTGDGGILTLAAQALDDFINQQSTLVSLAANGLRVVNNVLKAGKPQTALQSANDDLKNTQRVGDDLKKLQSQEVSALADVNRAIKNFGQVTSKNLKQYQQLVGQRKSILDQIADTDSNIAQNAQDTLDKQQTSFQATIDQQLRGKGTLTGRQIGSVTQVNRGGPGIGSSFGSLTSILGKVGPQIGAGIAQMAQSIAQTLGDPSKLKEADAAVLQTAQGTQKDLQDAYAKAAKKAQKDPRWQKVADDLLGQLETATTAVAQAQAQALTDAITAQDTAASRQLAALSIQDRLSAVRAATGDQLGATGQQISTSQARSSALTSQVAGYQGLLSQAQAQGNTGAVQELQDKISDLTTQIKEANEQTQQLITAYHQVSVSILTTQTQASSGFFGAATTIAQTLGTISGSMNLPALISYAKETASSLITEGQKAVKNITDTINDPSGPFGTNQGQAATFLNALTSAFQQGPQQFADTLSNLAPSLSSFEALLPPDQQQLFQQLVQSLIDNTTASVSNTQQLQQLNATGNQQQFTSSAWTMFRQAIFTGLGTLLPQYAMQVPSMDVGGMITDNGLLYGHRGETITPAGVRKGQLPASSNGDTHHHWNITNPTEVADPNYLGNAVAWRINHNPNAR